MDYTTLLDSIKNCIIWNIISLDIPFSESLMTHVIILHVKHVSCYVFIV